MLIATHCHAGGPTLNWGEEVRRNPDYINYLTNKAADAAICAYNRLDECKVCISSREQTGIGFIRVYNMKDGSLKTNPGKGNPNILSPAGKIDPEMLVLTVYRDEKPIGAVVNYACHPAVVAKDKTSGDFPSILARELKEKYGNKFVTLFINGACGNINHFNPYDPETYTDERYIYMGKMLADTAATAIENPDKELEGNIRTAENTIKVRIRKPSPEYLAEKKAILDNLGDDLINSVPGTPGYIDTFFALQAMSIQLDKRTLQDIYLNKVEIGNDLTIFGSPCQMFSDYGFKMKENSNTKYSMVSIFANDYRGYVPTPDKMRPGVYEARLAATSMLAPEAGDEVCDAILKL